MSLSSPFLLKRTVSFITPHYSRALLSSRLLCTDTPKDGSSLPSDPLPRSRTRAKTYQLGSARNKATLLKSFEDLSRKDDLPPVSAYKVLKNCGQQLADVTPEARVSLAEDFMEKFETKGVKLDVSHYNALLSVCIENSTKFSPSEFLTKLQDKRIQPTQTTYHLVLKGFCQQGNLQKAMEVLEHIKELGVHLSEPLLAPLVTCNAKCGDMDKAKDVLQLIRENGLEPGLASYSALLCAHAECGNMEAIQQVLGEMQANSVFPSHNVYIQVLESLSRSKHSDLIPGLLDKIRNKESMGKDFRRLLNNLVAFGDFEGALHILRCIGVTSPLHVRYAGQDFFRKLVKAEPSLSFDYFLKMARQLKAENLHAHAYEDLLYNRFLAKDKDGAISILKEMLTSNIEVMHHYFYPVLAFLEKEQNLEEACHVLKLMLDHEVAIEIPHFQYVVKAHLGTDRKKPHLAETLLNVFSECGIVLGRQVNSLIRVCCDLNHLDDAVKILESVDKNVVMPQRFLRSVVKEGYLREGIPMEDSAAMKIFKLVAELPETFVSLPQYASQFFLRNMEQMPDSSGLTSLFTSLETFFQMGIKIVHPKVYSALLRSCVDEQDLEQFLSVIRLMKESEITIYPHHHRLTVTMGALKGRSQMAQSAFSRFTEMETADWRIYSDLMIAYGRAKNLPAVNRVYEAMLKDSIGPSGPAFESAIMAYLNVGDIQSADQLMEDMVKKYRASYGVYASYIEAYSRVGNVAGARKKFEEMLARDYNPSPFAYQKLMAAHAFHGDHGTVLQIMEEMEAAGKSVDRHCWSSLVDAYINSEDVDSAKARIDEAKEKDIKPLLISYIKLLNLAVGKKRTDVVEELTKDMRAVINMNESDLQHLLLFAHVRAGDLAEAQNILQNPDFVAKKTSFLAFANSCARRGEAEKVVHTMDLLTKMDMKSKFRVFGIALLMACETNDDGEKALALYQTMKDERIEMSSRFLVLLSRILRNTGHEVPYAVPSADTAVDANDEDDDDDDDEWPSSDGVNT